MPSEFFCCSPNNRRKNKAIPADKDHLDFVIVALAPKPYLKKIQCHSFDIFANPTLNCDDPVHVIQHPEVIDAETTLKGDLKSTAGTIETIGDHAFFYNAPTKDGSSGSAVADFRGNLLGIHYQSQREGPKKRGSAVLITEIAKDLSSQNKEQIESRIALVDSIAESSTSADQSPSTDTQIRRCFLGREQEMNDLDNLLEKYRFVVIHGIGGEGKTELLKQYCIKNKHATDDIDGSTAGGREKGLQSIADMLGVPRTYDSVRHRLSDRDDLVIAIDDPDDEKIDEYIRQLIPEHGPKVLVTSRKKSILDRIDSPASETIIYKLHGLNEVDSKKLCEHYSNTKLDDDDSSALYEWTCGNPLVIWLFATDYCKPCIRTKKISIQALITEAKEDILSKDLTHFLSKLVNTRFTKHERALAEFISLIDKNRIPLWLLELWLSKKDQLMTVEIGGQRFDEIQKAKGSAKSIIGTSGLHNCAFLQRDHALQDDELYFVHPIIHEFYSDLMDNDQRVKHIKQAILLFRSLINSYSFENTTNWGDFESIMHHFEALVDRAKDAEVLNDKKWAITCSVVYAHFGLFYFAARMDPRRATRYLSLVNNHISATDAFHLTGLASAFQQAAHAWLTGRKLNSIAWNMARPLSMFLTGYIYDTLLGSLFSSRKLMREDTFYDIFDVFKSSEHVTFSVLAFFLNMYSWQITLSLDSGHKSQKSTWPFGIVRELFQNGLRYLLIGNENQEPSYLLEISSVFLNGALRFFIGRQALHTANFIKAEMHFKATLKCFEEIQMSQDHTLYNLVYINYLGNRTSVIKQKCCQRSLSIQEIPDIEQTLNDTVDEINTALDYLRASHGEYHEHVSLARYQLGRALLCRGWVRDRNVSDFQNAYQEFYQACYSLVKTTRMNSEMVVNILCKRSLRLYATRFYIALHEENATKRKSEMRNLKTVFEDLTKMPALEFARTHLEFVSAEENLNQDILYVSDWIKAKAYFYLGKVQNQLGDIDTATDVAQGLFRQELDVRNDAYGYLNRINDVY